MLDPAQYCERLTKTYLESLIILVSLSMVPFEGSGQAAHETST